MKKLLVILLLFFPITSVYGVSLKDFFDGGKELFEKGINKGKRTLDDVWNYDLDKLIKIERQKKEQVWQPDLKKREEIKKSKYVGIGISFHMDSTGIIIDQIIKGGGAEKRGLREGLLITHIDSKPVRGLSVYEAAERLMGPIGSKVRLQVNLYPEMTIERISIKYKTEKIKTGTDFSLTIAILGAIFFYSFVLFFCCYLLYALARALGYGKFIKVLISRIKIILKKLYD